MKIPFFSFEERNRQVRAKTLSAFEQFFDSGWYVLGDRTSLFEKKYALFNKVEYAVGVSTGLDALHLSLLALGIGEGDEVIVPSNTYIATVLAVTYTGAKPVFVEPRYETCNLNPELVERAITPKTKAIMPVHLYGQVCEMDEIMQIAKRNHLFVIEDNAQSQGAMYNGKLTGSFGDINATSFYPTKNLGALGEAGAVTTNDVELAEKVKILRNYGSQRTYYNQVIGYNNRIDEFEATFLGVSLDFIDSWTKERQYTHEFYCSNLKNIEEIKVNEVVKCATTVNHLFTIKAQNRRKLQEFLANRGIGTKIHYPVPPHLQDCYSHLGYKEGDFPIAEKLAKETLSLPNYLGLKKEEINYISSSIRDYYTKNLAIE